MHQESTPTPEQAKQHASWKPVAKR